jgi:hypothetical protein
LIAVDHVKLGPQHGKQPFSLVESDSAKLDAFEYSGHGSLNLLVVLGWSNFEFGFAFLARRHKPIETQLKSTDVSVLSDVDEFLYQFRPLIFYQLLH